MKHLIKLCIVVVGIVALLILSRSENGELKNLAFENIEALADGEGGNFLCWGNGSIDCGGYKVDIKIGPFR